MISQDDFTFLLELLLPPQERGFLEALHKDPDDEACRNALVDYLLESGRGLSAELVRKKYVPGKRQIPSPSWIASGGTSTYYLSSGSVSTYHISSGSIQSGYIGGMGTSHGGSPRSYRGDMSSEIGE